MRLFNRANYILINVLWAISVTISFVLTISSISTFVHILNSIVILCLVIIQFYGAFALYKERYTVPIIAVALLLFNFNFEGIKYVIDTLFFLKMEIVNGSLSFTGRLADPTVLINLTFDQFSFQMIGINLYTVIQLAFLVYEYDESKIESKKEVQPAL